jgi:uncharacterized protein YecE (DUF72 family)
MADNKTNLEKILRKAHNAIFSDQNTVTIEGKEYPIKKTSKKGLRCVYHDEYFFIEQNPNTNSHWAKKARNGEKITWAIKGNQYIANIHEGKFHYFD